MAYIVPSDITQIALSSGRSRELDTLELLKRRLSPAYSVFHGIHWTREYAGNTVFGELDFVIVNRSGDVLVIEQKSGRLDETNDGLVKHYGDRTKNVAQQVNRAIGR